MLQACLGPIVKLLNRLNKRLAVHHAHTIAEAGYLVTAMFHGGIYGFWAGMLLLVLLVGILIGEST